MPSPPHHRTARPVVVATTLALGLTLAGCQSSSAPAGPPTRATGDRGGTLQVLAATGAITHLDPQRMRTPAEADLGRLLYRGLTAFPTTAGPDDRHAVPDLAASPGRPSDDAKTWTFTLRSGLRFQDGSAITSADLRRGVERAFDPAFGTPPAYLTGVLDCGKSYAGPSSGDCPAIATPDPHTVVFHLRLPVGDFPDVVALPAFLPVPTGAGNDLDQHPIASGPYEVADYRPGQQIVLTRNRHWQEATDDVRPALPDRVEVSLDLDPGDVESRLTAGRDDDATAVPLGAAVPVTDAGRVAGDKDLSGRVDRGYDDGVDALALDVRVPPLDNVAVRTALVYAVSRAGYRQTLGGPAAGGPATTLLSPGLPAHRTFDLWHAPDDGAPDQARTRLSRAGYPDGFTVTFDAGGDTAGGQAITAALQQVGIITQPAKAGQPVGIRLVRVVPDRPAAAALLRPLLCTCGSRDMTHYASHDVDERIEAASRQTDAAAAERAWAEVDMRALQDVPMIPLLHRQVTRLHGAKVGNARLSPMYGGEYDLAALSVS